MDGYKDAQDASAGSTSGRPHSILAYEDEPLWVAYIREYLLPALVFAGLAYYLVFKVLVPMWHVGLPTRKPAAGFVAGHPQQLPQERDDVLATAACDSAAEATQEKKDA